MRYVGRYKVLLALVIVFLVLNTVLLRWAAPTCSSRSSTARDDGGRLCGGLCAGAGADGRRVSAGRRAASFAYARLMVHVSQRTVYAIRWDLFAKMQSLPIKYFDKHTHGELMSRYTNDIDTISEMINNSIGHADLRQR